ncbi:NADP-dependent oxidoreductase domain-containing protein [Sphaerosporella brunnea]|uniref:NADP-dependent oxidoreductase domain-containing protein n=1 Tax=Sphaerosporella brunnea TaxID=1250544 RepID=A0A5J5F0R5_9PEZI|nr:NADP-dependent oxidoreductase domain-containing protein [Sphaerosporella brunnea]
MASINGKPIGPIGLGLMGFTWRSHVTADAQAFDAMKAALAGGANFWNGGEFYGCAPTQTANLSLINRYFSAYPEDADKVVLSIKGGVDYEGSFMPRGDRAGVQKSVDNVLRLLGGAKFIDVFECARVDPSVPIEDTVAVLAEYVAAGKIGGIGLSEVSAATIRRAHKVHPIAAVEVEVSPWSTEIFAPGGVAETCAELGIPVVAYSPLGRGFLAGQVKAFEDIPEGDFRRVIDRFQPGNFEKNMRLVDEIEKVAEKKGITKAQLCLAWVRSRGNKEGLANIIPIPGATTRARVEENCALAEVENEELKKLDEILASLGVHGGRYNKHMEPLLMV